MFIEPRVDVSVALLLCVEGRMYAFVEDITWFETGIEARLEPALIVRVGFNVFRAVKGRDSNTRSAIATQEPTLERENETVWAKEWSTVVIVALAEFPMGEAGVNECKLEDHCIVLFSNDVTKQGPEDPAKNVVGDVILRIKTILNSIDEIADMEVAGAGVEKPTTRQVLRFWGHFAMTIGIELC